MPEERDPITQRVHDELEATEGYLRTPVVRRGEVWVVEQVVVSSDQGSGGYVDLYLDDGSRLTALESLTMTLPDSWYPFTALPVTALSGYRIVTRFRGMASGDAVRMNVQGYVREPFTSP